MKFRLFTFLLCVGTLAAQESPLNQLDVLSAGWPRVFFFRSAEGHASQPKVGYERWEGAFSQLMGIDGKALDEEIVGRSTKNIDFFTRFKKAHPQQMVMLHYDGLARDPLDAQGLFADGHWLYFNGAKMMSDVPAESGETDIAVTDVRLFKTNIGRYGDGKEDVGLCELDANGKPDWTKAEQVKLISVTPGERNSGTIRVQRAQFGSKARAFSKGKAYAAAHTNLGPFGKNSNLLWFYNFATTCPRDANGKTCSEVLAAEFGKHFTGDLAAFDGLEFDVMRHSYGDRRDARGRTIDADADGKADGGFVNGDDVYGAGTMAFCALLRKTLGKDKLILTDGWNWDHPRGFGSLNGMESEGWPRLGDDKIEDWCGGLNRGLWWSTRATQPVFNYINHKHLLGKPPADRSRRVEIPLDYAYNRIVFAAAMMLDAALCTSIEPPTNEGELTNVWDEFNGGVEKKLGWLGMPKGAAKHLAFDSPNMLSKALLTSENAIITEHDGFDIQGKDAAQELTTIQLNVPVDSNGELLLRYTASAQPSARIANKAPRILRVGTVENRYDLHFSWVDDKAIDYTFYATDLPAGEVKITFDIEGGEPFHLNNLIAHAHPDVMLREYDHGLVLANPSSKPYTFDLAKLVPGQKFRRLKGTALQDLKTNNGELVNDSVTIGPRDGLFLMKE